MVFLRNKELLIGVGRRDFELGSAPVFPAVRVEIDLEEWHTQRSACPTLSYTQFLKKKKKEEERSFLNVSLAFIIICRRELRQTEVLCNGMEYLWDFGLVKM